MVTIYGFSKTYVMKKKNGKNEQGGATGLIWMKITGKHHVRQNLWQIIKRTIDMLTGKSLVSENICKTSFGLFKSL